MLTNVVRRMGLGVALFLVPALSIAQPSQAPKGRVTRQTVILERPRGDSPVISTVPAGIVVELLEAQGDWYRVAVPTTGAGTNDRRASTGWMNRVAVELLPREAPPPAGQTAVSPAPASTPRTTSSRPTPIGVRGYFAADVDAMAAQKSFNAIVGTSMLTGFGGGVDVVNVWKAAFVRAAASRAQKNGNRAFVFNGQAISLNIPMKVTMTPIEVGGGWRFGSESRVTPYAGGALLLLRYAETSDFAGAGDNVSQTNRGYNAFGGVEIGLSKWLAAGAEAQYRGVPKAIGKAPVSQDFGETDLGGFTVRVLFGLKR